MTFRLKRLTLNQVKVHLVFKTQEASFDFIFLGPHLSEYCLANEVLQKRRSWDGITDILKEQRNIFSTSTVTHVFHRFDKMTCTVQKWHLPSILKYITKHSDFIHKSLTAKEQWDMSSAFLCIQSALGVMATGARSGTCLSCSPTAKETGSHKPSLSHPAPLLLNCYFFPRFKII